MPVSSADVETFEAARGRLEAIAYRMLGSATDAEDAVQDTFLRWASVDRDLVEVPEAWLTKVLTNLCLNQLGSARVRRETYVGRWLPEPLLAGDPMLGPAETVEQRDQVSMAMLTLLEQLSPIQRAVYVLREAFGHSHREIADILDISEATSQQALHRAGRRLTTQRPTAERRPAEVDDTTARRMVEEFVAAAASGETDPLVSLLTEHAVSVADGGGVAPARRSPVVGALGIARFLRGLFRAAATRPPALRDVLGDRLSLYPGTVNSGPAVLVVTDGTVSSVFCLQPDDGGRITALHVQVNPEKLARINHRWAASEHPEPLLSLG